MFTLFRKVYSALFVLQGLGLRRRGDWRLKYPDGDITVRFCHNYCRQLQSMYGGCIIWDPMP